MAEFRATQRPIHATILITHTHHDHTQGFPFFIPTRHPASTLHLFGPHLVTENLDEVLKREICPPVFPLGTEELASTRTLRYARNGDLIVLAGYGQPPQQYHLGEDPGEIPPDAVAIHIMHGYHHPKSGILFSRIHYQGRSVVIATDTEGFHRRRPQTHRLRARSRLAHPRRGIRRRRIRRPTFDPPGMGAQHVADGRRSRCGCQCRASGDDPSPSQSQRR